MNINPDENNNVNSELIRNESNSSQNKSESCSTRFVLYNNSNDSNNTDEEFNLKLTNSTNFITKLKRKLSTDSLDSLSEENTHNTVFAKLDNKTLPSVEAYLYESGLNVQFIDKNDKKLIKLNLKQYKPKQSIDSDNTLTTNAVAKNQINHISTASLGMNDFDDLPSESDISTGTTIVLPSAANSVLKRILPLENLSQNKSVSICYKCNNCNNFFNDESTLKSHQQTVCFINENIETNIDCGANFLECSKNIGISSELNESNEQLNEKVSSKSSKKRLFICNECGKQFHTQNDLNKHLLQVHESHKPYECSQCQMTFYDLSSKKRHEKEHLGYKPFRCYICTYEFTRASNLRTHLLKVHSNDIGKSVKITKSSDNKLKFEFDLDEINNQKEQIRQLQSLSRSNSASSINSQSTQSNNNPTNGLVSTSNSNCNTNNNAVIYIKDPNNKNADIQHMVVYVDGKPIFVQNPKIQNLNTINSPATTDSEDVSLVDQSSNKKKSTKKKPAINNNSMPINANRPVAKIPYLLAAAAAAAASNHRQQQQQMEKFQQQNSRLISNDYLTNSNTTSIKDLKQDQEYLQLVSMFKQKNEKLVFNPLLNKSF